MIVLSTTGGPVSVDPDLIERAELAPGTVLTLIDGTTHLVSESLEEVVERVRTSRASELAATVDISPAPVNPPIPLRRPVKGADPEVRAGLVASDGRSVGATGPSSSSGPGRGRYPT